MLASGCGGQGGGNGLSADAAHFEAEIRAGGATLHASGLSCSGFYGAWRVRLRVTGAATGSGSTAFSLEPGRDAAAPISFGIHAGPISGKATGVLRVRGRGDALAVRGRITVKVPFKRATRAIAQEIPVERGPDAGCGLNA